jgi:hypothetical protein
MTARKSSQIVDIRNVLFIPAAKRGPLVAPRYAFVRNVEWERLDAEHRAWHDARYDIVDNGEGSEQVLARGVHYKSATLIVGALNMMAEAERTEATRTETSEEEVPAPAPAA